MAQPPVSPPRPAVLPLADPWRDAPAMGPSHPRLDGPAKVRGKARYAYEDLGRGEVLVGWIVGATIAKGRILDLATTGAERAPGVVLVMTYRNAPRQAPPHPRVTPNRFDRSEPVLFQPAVRFYGEPVALVVAETLEAARAAAALIGVRYAPEPAALDFEGSLDTAYRPTGRINAGNEPDDAAGDFAAAFAAAPVTVDATYGTPHASPMPMEPHTAMAQWDGDRLTIRAPQQSIGGARGVLSKTLGIPEANIRILAGAIGGGFGAKAPVHASAMLAALAARAIGRPVKVAMTRPQMFANTNHRPASRQRLRLGATPDGRLTALAHDAIIQTTPHDEFIEQNAAYSRSMYACPNRLTTSRGVILDMPTGNIMRAPGEQPGSFALESAMDELAVALRMDPVELRIVNEPATNPQNGRPFSSRSLVTCLREGAARFGWSRRPATPGVLVDGEWDVGFGMACAMRPAVMRAAAAAVELRADGTAAGRADITEIGTGVLTAMTGVLAHELGLPIERVRMEIGDSDFPATPGSVGSFGAASTSAGIHLACEALRRLIGEHAAADPRSPLHGATGPVRLAAGRVTIGDRSEPLAEFLRRTAPDGLRATAGHGGHPGAMPFSAAAFGAHFLEVGVNRITAEIRVRRMLGAFAAGRILNERLARSQLIGGMIMGIGSGLTEEAIVDRRHGHFVNANLAEYHFPVHADIGEVEVLLVAEREEQASPLGVKGLGEVGIVGVAAALANAVFNATGVRVREAPVTLDKVLAGREGARPG